MNVNRKIFAAFSTGLLILLCCYYFPYLTGKASFYIYDLHAGWWPTFTYIGERLRQGQLPLWNPYAITGVSQIDIIAPTIFYPLNLIFAWLPFNQAYALLMIMQQMIMAIATFFLIASFGWGSCAAVMGGAALALCGTTFSLQPTPTLQGTIAWFVAAYFGQRIIDTHKGDAVIFHAACAAFLVYMMIVAGVAEAFAPGLLFFALHAIFEMAIVPKRKRRRAVLIMMLRLSSIAIGVLMSMCAVLPAIEWSRLSPRVLGLPLSELFSWSCNWYDNLCVWCVQPLGDMYEPTNPFRPLVATSANQTPYLANSFIGPLLATAGLWAVFDKNFKARWIAIAVLIGSLLLASGSHFTPLVAIVKALNLRMFRYPVKAMAFVAVSACILGARGIYLLSKGKKTHGNNAAWILWTILVALGLGLQNYDMALDISSLFHGHKLLVDALPRIGIAIAVSAGVGLQAALFHHLRMNSKSKWAFLFACVMIAETVLFFSFDAWRFNRHDGPFDLYKRPSIVADRIVELGYTDGNLRIAAIPYTNPYTPPLAIHEGPKVISIYGYAVDLMVPHTNSVHHMRNVTDTSVGETADHSILFKHARDKYNADKDSSLLGQFCQMSAAPLFINQLGKNIKSDGTVFEPFEPLDTKYFKKAFIDTNYNLGVYRVVDPLLRARFALEGRPYNTAKEALNAVLAPEKSGFEPHKVTVLEPDGTSIPKATIVDSQALAKCKVSFVDDRPEHIALDVSTPKLNYLVLADQFYPGWFATVDGSSATIFRADGTFRAVLVPEGRHRVEFTYAPPVLAFGLILHAVAWLMVIGLLGLSLIMRSQRLRAS